jgi:hypothetical protein
MDELKTILFKEDLRIKFGNDLTLKFSHYLKQAFMSLIDKKR